MVMEFLEGKDVKETLEELGVPFDDVYCLSDGSYGYWTILTSNLEEDHKSLLINLKFEEVKEDLWIKKVEGPEQIPDYKITELRKIRQEKIWSEILELIETINSISLSAEQELIFKPTTNFTISSTKLKGFLCTNSNEFSTFCEHFYKCLVESTSDRLPLDFKNKSFYRDIKELRHHCKHDRGHGKEKDIFKKYKKVSKIFLDLIVKKWPTERDDYINLELKILEKCKRWLKELVQNLV